MSMIDMEPRWIQPAAVLRVIMLVVLAGLLAGCGNIADKYKRNRDAAQPPPPPPPSEQELAARIFSPSFARVAAAFDLDASGSTGGTPQQLGYAWALVAAPEGSTAAISGPNLRIASFTPDLPGEYEFRLTVSRGNQSDTATATTSVVPPVTFVSRVQTGVVEWTDFNSNTLETIVLDHSVDLDRTLFMMTVRAERINPRMARYTPTYEFLDDRTIELRTGSPPNDPMYVAWTVVEFTPEAVIGVQRGTVDRGQGPEAFTNISLPIPVDPHRAFALPSLHQTQSVHEYAAANAFAAKLFEDGSALRLESELRPNPGNTLSQWQVIEFTQDSGVEVQAVELDVRPTPEIQEFQIDPVDVGSTFLLSGGQSISVGSPTFPVRQAFQAILADPETIAIRKNIVGLSPTQYRAVIYVVSVAGAEVYPFGGTFAQGSAFPVAQPSWPAIDVSRFDPVVMSGWNAFQFIWGSDDNTAHTDLMYTVVLNPESDGVTVERGLIESARRQRDYNGYVLAWPRN